MRALYFQYVYCVVSGDVRAQRADFYPMPERTQCRETFPLYRSSTAELGATAR
jgi:hypothetical protein